MQIEVCAVIIRTKRNKVNKKEANKKKVIDSNKNVT